VATLLVGFDSAWTPGNRGAIVAAFQEDDGSFRDLGDPRIADFLEAENAIRQWQADELQALTVILLDQPTVVGNSAGQRPVENIVSSCVSLRYGGMQPANTGRADMFGHGAPVWPFLDQFGGAADPFAAVNGNALVFETYPVLAMIALGWLREDARAAGRLPKYNPERKKTFSLDDWQFVCDMAALAFHERGLAGISRWIFEARELARPRKSDQDKLDACLCLLVALHLAEGRNCLMVGDWETGYIVVPHNPHLQEEIETRCGVTARLAHEWIRTFKFGVPGIR
jgi:predicted RNase H-like nuclease